MHYFKLTREIEIKKVVCFSFRSAYFKSVSKDF